MQVIIVRIGKTHPLFLLILTIFSIFFSVFAAGDQIARISESSISRQIHQPTITAIYKDRKGYLWIGTQHGLYKHDGSKLTLFNSEQNIRNWIPVSDISGIAEDADGNTLVATFGAGLLKWSNSTNRFKKVSASGGHEAVNLTHIVSNDSGEVWTATKEDVFLHSLRGYSHETMPVTDVHNSALGKVSTITASNDGEIFLANGLEVYKVSSDKTSMSSIPWSTDEGRIASDVSAITTDSNGSLYIGTEDGHVVAIDLKNHTISGRSTISSTASVSIYQLVFHANRLWIGTNNGLYYSNRSLSSFEALRHDNSQLSNDHVTAIYSDQNFLWVGTYQGLNIISLVPFRTFDEKNSRVFEDILAFEQDSTGRLWVGTYSGLYMFTETEGSHLNLADSSFFSSIRDQRVMTIASQDAELWVGFRKNGAQIINIETGEVTTPEIPDAHNLEVTKILHSSDEKTWLATYNRGLYSIKNEEVTSHLDDGSLPEASITVLLELDSGRLLASSEQDIYLYNLSEGRFNLLELKFENSARPPMILSLSQSSNGDIWVGTKDQGLFIWPVENHKADSHNLRRVNQDGEMPPSTIYAIEFDGEGNAWCSTQQGIIKLDEDGRFLARFTSADGLQGDDFNFSASFIDNQGRMYFGGSNGYSRFTPEEVDIDSTPPRLSLNNIDISSDGEVFSYDATDLQTLELGHEDQHVRFDFGVLDFLDPEKNQYRHKLEGLDRVWIDNGTRSSASYTDIPAGKYVLKIQGSNSAGVWNRDGLSLNIQVAPPAWRTWWAKCIYSVLLALLGWFGKRVYDSYSIERRATQLAMERHHAAELADDEMQEQLEIQDNLVKSAYQHNVETLTLINDVISAQSETVTDVTARRLAGTAIERVNALALLEDCLYHQNEALLVDLHKYTDIITTRLLQDSPVREETITTINEVSASLLPIEPGAPLAIALYELLENSIQHAFKEEALANYIHISFTNEYLTEQSAFRYCLTVQDNGRGLPVDVDPQAQDSAGMAILHTMAERLAGSLNFNSKDGTSISLSFTYKERL